MWRRSAPKPLCISAAIERAWARAAGSAGHSPAAGRCSARYSTIASESQITRVPWCRTGTLPAGDWARSAAWEPGSDSRTRRSSKSMPARRAASQPRSDHDE